MLSSTQYVEDELKKINGLIDARSEELQIKERLLKEKIRAFEKWERNAHEALRRHAESLLRHAMGRVKEVADRHASKAKMILDTSEVLVELYAQQKAQLQKLTHSFQEPQKQLAIYKSRLDAERRRGKVLLQRLTVAQHENNRLQELVRTVTPTPVPPHSPSKLFHGSEFSDHTEDELSLKQNEEAGTTLEPISQLNQWLVMPESRSPNRSVNASPFHQDAGIVHESQLTAACHGVFVDDMGDPDPLYHTTTVVHPTALCGTRGNARSASFTKEHVLSLSKPSVNSSVTSSNARNSLRASSFQPSTNDAVDGSLPPTLLTSMPYTTQNHSVSRYPPFNPYEGDATHTAPVPVDIREHQNKTSNAAPPPDALEKGTAFVDGITSTAPSGNFSIALSRGHTRGRDPVSLLSSNSPLLSLNKKLGKSINYQRQHSHIGASSLAPQSTLLNSLECMENPKVYQNQLCTVSSLSSHGSVLTNGVEASDLRSTKPVDYRRRPFRSLSCDNALRYDRKPSRISPRLGLRLGSPLLATFEKKPTHLPNHTPLVNDKKTMPKSTVLQSLPRPVKFVSQNRPLQQSTNSLPLVDSDRQIIESANLLRKLAQRMETKKMLLSFKA